MSKLNKHLKRIIESRLSPAEKLDGVKKIFAEDQEFRKEENKRCQLDFNEKHSKGISSAKRAGGIVYVDLDPLGLAVFYRELGLVNYLSKYLYNVSFSIFMAIYLENLTREPTIASGYLAILRFLLSQNPAGVDIDYAYLPSETNFESIFAASRNRPSQNIITAFYNLQKLMQIAEKLALPSLPASAEVKESDKAIAKDDIPICYTQAKQLLLKICQLDSLLAIDYLTKRLRETCRRDSSANVKALKPVLLNFINQLIEWFTIKGALRPDIHARLANRLIAQCHFSPTTLAQFVLASAHEQVSTREFLQKCGERFLKQKKPEKALKSLLNFTRQLAQQGIRKLNTPEYQFIIDVLLSLWSNPSFTLQGPFADKDKKNELLTAVLKGNQPVEALNLLMQKPGEALGLDAIDEEQKKPAVMLPPAHLSIWLQPKLIETYRSQGRRRTL